MLPRRFLWRNNNLRAVAYNEAIKYYRLVLSDANHSEPNRKTLYISLKQNICLITKRVPYTPSLHKRHSHHTA